MSQSVSIDTGELDDFLKKLGTVTLYASFQRSLKKSVLLLERNAKIRTPVRTGLLKNSYESEFSTLSATFRNFREYAPYVEAKKHFFSDAVDETEPRIHDIFRSDIQQTIQSLL